MNVCGCDIPKLSPYLSYSPETSSSFARFVSLSSVWRHVISKLLLVFGRRLCLINITIENAERMHVISANMVWILDEVTIVGNTSKLCETFKLHILFLIGGSISQNGFYPDL